MTCPNIAPLVILAFVLAGLNVIQFFIGAWLIGALIEERNKGKKP